MRLKKSNYTFLFIYLLAIVCFCRDNFYINKISCFEQKMFKNYSNGTGNVRLEENEFQRLVTFIRTSVNLKAIHGYDVMLENGKQGKSYIISLYGTPEFDHAFGTATIYVDENYEVVGFMDIYDFDSRPWGQRSYKSELLSRFIKTFSPKKAKPFKITYGLQYSPPIYDVLSRSTISNVS